MGWLSWVGYGPSKTRVTARDKAVLDLKLQRDKIRQYQKRIAGVQQREHALAKQCLAQGDRRRALLFLRKEKFQRQLLAKTDGQLATLEELVSSIEFAQVQRDVAFGLELGASTLKAINEEMSLERIERLMDDSAEGIAYQQEVSEMLSQRITNPEEAEIQDELEAMQADALRAAAPSRKDDAVPVHRLPDAPTTLPKLAENEREAAAQTQAETKTQAASPEAEADEPQPIAA